MTDSIAVLSVAERITDASGVPVSGAKLKFYQTGTSTPLAVYADAELETSLGSTVYCDSAGFPVTAENGSTKTQIYTGASSYKVIITDVDDVAIITLDNVKGALDTSEFSGGGTVLQQVPVVAKSASYTVDEDTDNGILFDVNCTGGNATMTLPSAVDAGDGFYVGFRHNGTANAVIPATVSSQTIRHTANTGAADLPTKVALTGKGETIWLASDGANWVAYGYVPALINNTTGVIVIADRLSAPPSHTAGNRYILTSSPSGAWSTFAEHDIVESDGTAWFKRTPPTDCGWIAYVQDEDLHYTRIGSAWVILKDVLAVQADMEAASSILKPVTPGVQKYHPLHAKARGVIGVAGDITEGTGIASVSDDGAGSATLTWLTPFTTANYAVVATPQITGASSGRFMAIGTRSTTACQLVSRSSSETALDPTSYNVAAFGDL